MDVLHARIQHGVGQGSFHSATVEARIDDDRARFDYVYDCGAKSGGGMSRALKRQIKRLGLEQREGSSGRAVLDVLVLSHYDSDHLNGIKQCSEEFDVGRLFLPYLSSEELAFIIASQAEALNAEQVTELHQLAHGRGTLWGVPVTMVRGGEGGGGELSALPDAPPPRNSKRDIANGAPQSVQLRLRGAAMGGGTGGLPAVMSHEQDVSAEIPSGRRLWKLRFWNRGLETKLITEITNELTACGFPLDKLEDPLGAVHVIKWLAMPKNRKRAVKAYGDAISTVNPSWAHEARSEGLGNLLSLAMYAGPAFEVDIVLCMRRHRSTSHYWHAFNEHRNGGWLGTGDAPLGEAAVWADFQVHFVSELSNVCTYLVPHHGAAPRGGPSYYNAGLNSTPGMASVISYGTTNTYGHPRFSVLTQIMAKGGELFEVTEEDENGFHEVFRYGGS